MQKTAALLAAVFPHLPKNHVVLPKCPPPPQPRRRLKVATLFADWRSTKLSSLILLNSSVFLAKNLSQAHDQLWQQLPCNAKPTGTTFTCNAGNTIALKASLSNVLSKTLQLGTAFGSVSALSLEKTSKNIQT